MRIRPWHVLVLGLLGAGAASLLVGGVKTDPDSVHRYAGERIAEQFPGAKVRTIGPTEFDVDHPNGRRAIGDVAPAQAICKRTPRKCLDAVDDLLIGLMEALEGESTPSTDALRPIIAPAAAIARPLVVPIDDDDAAQRPISMPLAGGLAIGYVTITANAVTPLTAGMLARLGISPDRLRPLAIEAVERHTALPQPSLLFGTNGVYELRGLYASAQLLSRERLAAIERSIGAPRARALRVGIPAHDRVFLADADQTAATVELGKIVQNVYAQAPRPVSENIYLVTADHWQLDRQ